MKIFHCILLGFFIILTTITFALGSLFFFIDGFYFISIVFYLITIGLGFNVHKFFRKLID